MNAVGEDVVLRASDLLSKWGFCDGEILDDLLFDYELDGSAHATLVTLVRLYLLPVIEAAGHTVEAYEIGTIHNPIRARTLDGEPVDDTDLRDSTPLDGIDVTVPAAEVLALARGAAPK